MRVFSPSRPQKQVLNDIIPKKRHPLTRAPSLFHFFKSEVPEGPDQYVANIRETVNQRYRLDGKSLKSSGADLFYEAFANDSPREIAKFYFGPLAPASVIMKANSEWRKTFGNREGYSEGDFALPAGTQVRVALPEDWIKHFYR